MLALNPDEKARTFSLTEKQIELRDDVLISGARHCLIYGGSRSGKTFLIVYAMVVRALMAPGSRHLILGRYLGMVRDAIFQDTFPKVMALAFPEVTWTSKVSQEFFVQFPNGSQIWFGGLDDNKRADKVLGREYVTIYFNECSLITYTSVLVARSRLAMVCKRKDGSKLPNRAYYDLNPTSSAHWTYKEFVEGVMPGSGKPATSRAHSFANPADNPHLDDEYLEELESMPEVERKRFFEGQYLTEVPGALWQLRQLDQARLAAIPEPLVRVVVGVDPPATSGANADECGIIAAGLGSSGKFYVLEDASLAHASPAAWASVAVRSFMSNDADRIVAEVNQGGEMVESVIREIEPNISYKAVRATRGKVTRAEPVAAAYEKGMVHHVGRFPDLEQQMCDFTAGFDSKKAGWSPDRLDALVWALTSLMDNNSKPKPRVRTL